MRLSLRRCPNPCGGWLRVHAEGKLLSGVFLDRGGDVLGRRSLLEGVVAALSVPLRTPGENLRSLDRAATAHGVVIFLKTPLLSTRNVASSRLLWRWLQLWWHPFAELSPARRTSSALRRFLLGATWCLSTALVVSGGARRCPPVISSASLLKASLLSLTAALWSVAAIVGGRL